MPALFVPEERWGPGSWGANHPLTAQAQIHHGLDEAGYGYWGFSPSNIPEGGYAAYGVDAVGMDPNGNPSNEDRTLVDAGFAGCDGRPAAAGAAAVGLHERGRHAARRVPGAALRARRGAGEPRAPGPRLPGALRRARVPRQRERRRPGAVSDSYLSLDQGMIMAAIGNALAGDMLRRAFAGPRLRAGAATADGRRGVRCRSARLHDHRDRRGEQTAWSGRGATTSSAAAAATTSIAGGGGDDAIFGDGGNDRVDGGRGKDTLYGDAGDDRLDGDVVEGGDGTDRCRGEFEDGCE